jgi:hypothetical protein
MRSNGRSGRSICRRHELGLGRDLNWMFPPVEGERIRKWERLNTTFTIPCHLFPIVLGFVIKGRHVIFADSCRVNTPMKVGQHEL